MTMFANRKTMVRGVAFVVSFAGIVAVSQAQACCVHGYRGSGMGMGGLGTGLAIGAGLALVGTMAAHANAQAQADAAAAAAAVPPRRFAPRAPRVVGTGYMEDTGNGASLAKVYLSDRTELVSRDGGPVVRQKTNRPPKYMGKYRSLPDGGSVDRFVDRNTGKTYLQMTDASGNRVAVQGSMNGIPFR